MENLAILVIILLALWLMPLAGIWAVNVLAASFTAARIDYGFWQWLAMIVLMFLFSGSSSSK